MNLAELIANLKAGQLTVAKNELIRSGKLIEESRENADRNQFLTGRHNAQTVDYLGENFVVQTHNGNIINIIHSGVATYQNHHYNKSI